jgi:hypothetical protein
MKAAPAAIAVGAFFLVGLAGGAYWRTMAHDGGSTAAADRRPRNGTTAPTIVTVQQSSPTPSVLLPRTPPTSSSAVAPTTIEVSPAPSTQTAAIDPAPAISAASANTAPRETKRDDAKKEEAKKDSAKKAEPPSHAEDGEPAAHADLHLPATKPTPPAADERLAAKAPPPPAHQDARAPNGSGPFQVQFGMFTSEENANRLSRALSTPQVKITVQRSQDRAGRPVYYVRSPVFDDFARAMAAAWDAQNAAQADHFGEPVKYVIVRINASSGVASNLAVSQEASGPR